MARSLTAAQVLLVASLTLIFVASSAEVRSNRKSSDLKENGLGWCWRPARFNRTQLPTRLREVSSEGILFLEENGEGKAADGHFNPIVINDDGNFARGAIGGPSPDMKFVNKSRPGAWPPQNYRDRGYRHVGDADYSSKIKTIIAPLSGWPFPLVGPAFLGVDSQTLDPAPHKFKCDLNTSQVGQVFNPWVAVWGDFMYAADYNMAQVVYVYRIVSGGGSGNVGDDKPQFTCAFEKVVPMSLPLLMTQGGVMFNETTLLISDDTECIYSIDLNTGATTTSYCFWFAGQKLFEMEGLALQDLTSVGMGRLQVQAGSFGIPSWKRGYIFHLDYIC